MKTQYHYKSLIDVARNIIVELKHLTNELG